MRKKGLTALLILFLFNSAYSQTLFTYGSHKVDAKEFLRAFNKNNQQPNAARSKAIRDYLDLYINSRLKIREAYDRQYDTLPQIRSEVDVLRSQVIENYMNSPETINRLTKEAFDRSQKDIHAAHIFISLKDASGNYDTTTANAKLAEVKKRLQKGDDFSLVAQQLSDDPSAKDNKGDLDYITVFGLPYEFENILYSTPVGKYSETYTSRAGYHIFRNLGERKAIGKVKIRQILLAFPPDADAATKARIAKVADSIYSRLLKGDDFGKLASAFSNDNISAAAEGNIPEIGVGQYDADFEKLIWGLPNNSISKPFLTNHGYHIVKKISSTPVVSNRADKANNELLQQRIMSDGRWKTANDFIYALVREKAPYRRADYKDNELWALSDSMLEFKPVGIGKSMSSESPIYSLGDTTIRVQDWITYAQVNRYRADRSGVKPYPELMDEFVKSTFYQYYRAHLEDYNQEFKTQMAEFRDGNLFFEIMQQEVWNKAQSDSVALMKLYEKNVQQYNWKSSANAVIFFCSDEATSKSLADLVKKDPKSWRKIVEPMGEKVIADSGRYEWEQIPGLTKSGSSIAITPKANSITAISVNPTDKTASFAYILSVLAQPSTRSFPEARGLVMNDYQTLLEEEWIKELKKKYPVVVDQKVLAGL